MDGDVIHKDDMDGDVIHKDDMDGDVIHKEDKNYSKKVSSTNLKH